MPRTRVTRGVRNEEHEGRRLRRADTPCPYIIDWHKGISIHTIHNQTCGRGMAPPLQGRYVQWKSIQTIHIQTQRNGIARSAAHKPAEATVFASAAFTAQQAQRPTPAGEPGGPLPTGGKGTDKQEKNPPPARSAVTAQGAKPLVLLGKACYDSIKHMRVKPNDPEGVK